VADLVRQADTTKLQGQLAKVNEVVGLLKSPVLHRLIAIHTSERLVMWLRGVVPCHCQCTECGVLSFSQVTLLASQFTQREKRLDKLQGKLMDLEDKTVEAQKTAARIQPTLQQYMKDVCGFWSGFAFHQVWCSSSLFANASFCGQIAELKALVQSTISEMYEKRPVHVMGAINTL
jgi:hypothetical protein